MEEVKMMNNGNRVVCDECVKYIATNYLIEGVASHVYQVANATQSVACVMPAGLHQHQDYTEPYDVGHYDSLCKRCNMMKKM